MCIQSNVLFLYMLCFCCLDMTNYDYQMVKLTTVSILTNSDFSLKTGF